MKHSGYHTCSRIQVLKDVPPNWISRPISLANLFISSALQLYDLQQPSGSGSVNKLFSFQ